MPNTVNKKHFADQCGVSRAAITKACQAGLIGTDAKGNVNLDRSITKSYLKDKLAKKAAKDRKQPVKPLPRPPKKKPGPKPKPKPQQEAPEIIFPELTNLDQINGNNIHLYDKGDIDKFKSLETALSTKTKREELLGTLIKRSTVRTVFAKLHTIDTNQWKTLEDRLAPGISGIFGFEEGCKEEVEVRRQINEEVAKTLRHEKRLLDDFLIKHGEVGL
jgi:hypothetical protein